MREDFYYRIKVLTIEVPALRDRREDIPLLIDHLCMQIANTTAVQLLPQNLRSAMENYDWPGNVRELRNCIERYIVLGESDLMALIMLSQQRSDISSEIHGCIHESKRFSAQQPLKNIVADIEREVIQRTIAHYNDNKGQAAKALGISIQSLYRKLAK